MKQSEFELVFARAMEQAKGLLQTKGVEYAGGADRLANFKRGADLTGCTPLQVAFVYASKHYDAIATYVQRDAQGFEQKLSEPIEGRLHDLLNYCVLTIALIEDGRPQEKPALGLREAPQEDFLTRVANLTKEI